MPFGHILSHKEKASTAYKEKLLKELEYYDRRIQEFSNIKILTNDCYDSSDSDTELPICKPVEAIQDVTHFLHEKDKLKTCLNATQELTGLTVLESEISILSDDPMFADKLSLEPGLWREVLAECRVDSVPISITFFIHQPHRRFAPPSFHALRVVPVKAAHEIELKSSVLNKAKTPSEVYEVIKNYAVANRSRRSTLSKLAEVFPTTLFMEPLEDGGYKMKCADLLEVCWRLTNDVSTVAPFQHKFKFDLEYLEESYLRSIKECYKQLSYPKLETDERTLLLAKIIQTCLDAKSIEEVNMAPDDAEIEKIPEVEIDEAAISNKKQKQLSDNKNNKTNEAKKDMQRKKKKQNEKNMKENQDPNSKEVKNKRNLNVSENIKRNANEIDESNGGKNKIQNEELNVQKESDDTTKLVQVDNAVEKSKENIKIMKKKSSVGQNMNNLQSNKVIDKGINSEGQNVIMDTNLKVSDGQNIKTVQRSKVAENNGIVNADMKHLEGKNIKNVQRNVIHITESANVKSSYGQKVKNVQSSKVSEINGIENGIMKHSENQKIKIVQRSDNNNDKVIEHANVRSEGEKVKTVKRNEINKNKAIRRTNVKLANVQKLKTVQRSNIINGKDIETVNMKSTKVKSSEINNNVKSVTEKSSDLDKKRQEVRRNDVNKDIENKLKKQDLHKTTAKVNSKEVRKGKDLKRKVEETNKQTDVKKTKTSTEISEINKNEALKKNKVTKERENTNKINQKITKNINADKNKQMGSEKDLAKLNQNKNTIEDKNGDLINNKSENDRIVAESDKDTAHDKDNNKVMRNVDKNKNPNIIEINKKHIPSKNKLHDQKSSKTQIKDGVNKTSKPLLSEKRNNDNLNVGNPDPSSSVASSKFNSIDSKEIINGLIDNTDNEIVKKSEKYTTKKTSKIVASSQNKIITSKTVFKDRVLGSNGPAKSIFQKVVKNKVPNLNFNSKFRKVSPGKIAKNGDGSRIPQKRMSPNLRNVIKNQIRKSPRNLATNMKRIDKPVSNIPRIVKPVRPHK